MKISKWLAVAVTTGIITMMAVPDADAKRRLGGGGNKGVQREQTAPTPSTAAPAAPNASAAAPGAAARPGMPAAAPNAALNSAAKPSFMSRFGGPLAGILAGTALGYMLSKMGLGSGFLGLLMMLLIGGAIAFVVFRFIRSRQNAGGNLAAAGAAGGSYGMPQSGTTTAPAAARTDTAGVAAGAATAGAVGAASGAKNIFGQPLSTNGVAPAQFDSNYVDQRTQAPKIPADFAVEPFVNEAKKQFVRLQAANDSGNVDTLRNFMTPELYAELAPEIMSRGGTQRVDIMTLNATLLEVAEESSQFVASVRFTGTMKDEAEPTAEGYDEIWHIAKAKPNGGWLLAGIQQVS